MSYKADLDTSVLQGEFCMYNYIINDSIPQKYDKIQNTFPIKVI